jgi:hypothetical protein
LVYLPLLVRAWYLQGLPIPAVWVCSLPECPGTGHKQITRPRPDPWGRRSLFAVLPDARPLPA